MCHCRCSFVGLSYTQETTTRAVPPQECTGCSDESTVAPASDPCSLPHAQAVSRLRLTAAHKAGLTWAPCIASGRSNTGARTIILQPLGLTPALQLTGLQSS